MPMNNQRFKYLQQWTAAENIRRSKARTKAQAWWLVWFDFKQLIKCVGRALIGK